MGVPCFSKIETDSEGAASADRLVRKRAAPSEAHGHAVCFRGAERGREPVRPPRRGVPTELVCSDTLQPILRSFRDHQVTDVRRHVDQNVLKNGN